MDIDGADEFDEFADATQEFSARLGETVDDGIEVSLDDLQVKIRNSLNSRRINSPSWRETDGKLASKKYWETIQLTTGEFTLRPKEAVRERAVALEFDKDPEDRAPAGTTMTFEVGQKGNWVTVTPETMESRRNNASGWWRSAVRTWENKNNLTSEIADEIEQTLQEVYNT